MSQFYTQNVTSQWKGPSRKHVRCLPHCLCASKSISLPGNVDEERHDVVVVTVLDAGLSSLHLRHISSVRMATPLEPVTNTCITINIIETKLETKHVLFSYTTLRRTLCSCRTMLLSIKFVNDTISTFSS